MRRVPHRIFIPVAITQEIIVRPDSRPSPAAFAKRERRLAGDQVNRYQLVHKIADKHERLPR